MAARTWSFLKENSDGGGGSYLALSSGVVSQRPFSLGVVYAIPANTVAEGPFGISCGGGSVVFSVGAELQNALTTFFDNDGRLDADAPTPLCYLVHAHVNAPSGGDAELWINGLLAATLSVTYAAAPSPAVKLIAAGVLVAGGYFHSDALDDADVAGLYAAIAHQKDVPNIILPSSFERLDYVWSVKRGNPFGNVTSWVSEGGAASPLALDIFGDVGSVEAVEELPWWDASTASAPSPGPG